LFRKDALLANFVDAIKYEKSIAVKRSKPKKTSHFDFRSQAIKRRIIHLYQRAVRKFKHTLPLLKEYLHYLFEVKAAQKLNRVLADALAMHPTVPDFWLLAAYNELELKGNLFSGRKLLLQAMRTINTANMALEYLRFEIRLLAKVKGR